MYRKRQFWTVDTLCLKKSNTTRGHICLYFTLLIGNREHLGQIRAHFFMAIWTQEIAQSNDYNCQDMVFIWPPGISDGAFQLRIDNIWFCKVLLLFSIDTKTDAGIKTHECAYVSVLEEYTDRRRPSHILHILHILYIGYSLHILHIMH